MALVIILDFTTLLTDNDYGLEDYDFYSVALEPILKFIDISLAMSPTLNVSLIGLANGHLSQPCEWLFQSDNLSVGVGGMGSRLNCQTQWQDDCKDQIHGWLSDSEVIQKSRSSTSSSTSSSSFSNAYAKISSAISMALSYLNVKKSSNGSSSGGQISFFNSQRVLIVSSSNDDASQYVPLMNTLFSAQKAEIVIDLISMTRQQKNPFLKQLVALTGGHCLILDDNSAKKSQIWKGLMGISAVHCMGLRSMSSPFVGDFASICFSDLDFRASCVCHGTVIHKGYVCPVCLSVYCQILPQGTTCIRCGF